MFWCPFEGMTPFVRFLLFNLPGGFAIGLLAGLFEYRTVRAAADRGVPAVVELWATFGMAAVGSGLAFLAHK